VIDVRPLRPILLLLLVALALGGGMILPGPPWLEAMDQGGGATKTIADLVVDLGGPVLPILVLGFLGGLIATDGASLRAGGAFLCGIERPSTLPAAQRALAACSRAVVDAGMLVSLLAAAAAFFLVRDLQAREEHASPVLIASLVLYSTITPAAALAIGRIALGGAATAAALRAGVGERRIFGGWNDLRLLLFLIPPVALSLVVAWPARTIH